MTIGVGTFSVTPRMRELVNQVLDSGRISYGPLSREFERRFAALHGCRFAVLSNSGTSSLQVALQTLKEIHGWQDGDEVIVPAVTFVATVNVVLQNNLKPVLVDVETDTYGIDPLLIDYAVTPRTRAIIPVHLFGQPCGVSTVMAIARNYNLKVVEDSCEAMFVSHDGQRVGSIGDIGCFSTYVAHLLTTGVGGLATTNEPVYAATMRSLVNHGRDGIYISIDDDDNVANRREVISRRFNFERIGHSYRITELEAALGLAQLDDWQTMIRRRRLNAHYLTEGLRRYDHYLHLPQEAEPGEHAYMMYPIVVRHGRKGDLAYWLENHGIETREMLPLIYQPCYQGLWNPDNYPNAQWIDQGGFYVGCHQDLTRADLDYMIETIGAWCERARVPRTSLVSA